MTLLHPCAMLAKGAFEGLDEVGTEGVAEKHGHGLFRSEVAGADLPPVFTISDDDVAKAPFEVAKRGGEAEHRHDFACRRDDEAVLAGDAVDGAAQPHLHHAEGAVVEVEAPAPDDLFYAEGVAELDVVVDEGGEEIVGGSDGVEVAREVQVDVLHGDDLRISAPARAALYAEDGTERGLPQGETGIETQLAHPVREPDADRGLALAERGGVHRRDEDELRSALVGGGQGHLGFELAVRLDVLGRVAERGCDVRDGTGLGVSCDLDV